MKKYISGSIRKIIFESNTGPYKVGIFKVKETNSEDLNEYVGKVIGFTGSFNEINEDVDYILYGDMVNHPKYGLQFNCESYEIKEPSDEEGLILYLSSGMFKGIGDKTAKRIVDRFKGDTLDIIKNDYERLASVSGMTIEKAKNMHDKIVNSELNQDMIIKLNAMGFSVKESVDLLSIYGIDINNVIEDDIYELVDYVNFDKLDLMFLKNHDEFSSSRIDALIKHNLKNMCYENGDTIIGKEELFIRLKRCFRGNFKVDEFLAHVKSLLDMQELIEVNGDLMLYDFYIAESSILKDISKINNVKNLIKSEKLDNYIESYEKEYSINFGEEQIDAIKGAIKNNFFIITGGPGTGKTTIIKAIVNILESFEKIKEYDIALLAPTGRSAKRMSESVGIPAYTIHKYLKWNKESKTFRVDEYNKTKEKVIIVDEASMIDIFLMNSLLKGIQSNVKLLLIGDANQLPSIAPGDVLNDLLKIDFIKSKCLNTIYRVKEGSYISYFASEIKNKKVFDEFGEYTDFNFISSSDDDIMYHINSICKNVKGSLDNFQVLAPMYKGLNGIDNLNGMMANIFNSENDPVQVGDKYYRVGDKVIQLFNDVENNVFNGDIGYIESIEIIDKKLIVRVDYMGNIVEYKTGEFDRFTLAYAISIHKSQGSEYDNVVVVLAKSFRRMFYNKLIYTAVTRAKKSLTIIGTIEALNESVRTSYAEERNTYLKYI